MKSPTLARFTEEYQRQLDSLFEEYNKQVKTATGDKLAESQQTLGRIKRARQAFRKNIMNRVYGGQVGEDKGGGGGETGGEEKH
jgi:hypothetical protein